MDDNKKRLLKVLDTILIQVPMHHPKGKSTFDLIYTLKALLFNFRTFSVRKADANEQAGSDTR